MQNKIIITGGLGFIFSHVTEHFLQRGYDVYVIDNLSAGSHPELIEQFKQANVLYYTACDSKSDQLIQNELYEAGHGDIIKMPTALTKEENTNGRFTFIECDVSHDMVIPIIKTIDPQYIVHAAAISDVDYSITNPLETLQNNNRATINVFEAARQCLSLKKLLYVSTDEVYGECDHPKTEDEIIFPKNPYSLSKAFGSILRLAYDNTYAELTDKTVETRFCNVFGPRQDDRKVIPAIKRALNGGAPLELHNDGNGYRQYIHVSEIPPVVELLLERGSRTYNVTAGEGFTVNQLIKEAELYTGKTVPTVPAKRAGMDMRYDMSSQRLRTELGWKPKQGFTMTFQKYLCQ